MSRSTFLYPDVPALLHVGAGSLSIRNLTSGWRCDATGVVADAVWTALERREAAERGGDSEVLSALGERHELRATLSLLEGQRRLELTPTTALTLGQRDTLFVEVTGECNERCIHCYADAAPDVASALDRQTCEAIIADAAALGFRRVQLTGGEPLLCPFLDNLVNDVHAARMACEVYTNGLLLDEERLARLDPGHVQLAFSFYSHDPSVHDSITRRHGSQRSTSVAIQRAVQAGFVVRVAIVVMKQNAAGVPRTRALLRSLGVPMVTASAAHGVGRGTHFDGSWHVGDADSPDDRLSIQMHGKLCVASDGRVLPCIFNRADVLGSIHRRGLRDIIADPRLPRSSTAARLEDHQRQLQCWSCRLTAFALRECARSRSRSSAPEKD